MTRAENVSTLSAQIQALLKEILKENIKDSGLFCDYVEKAIVLAERLHDENDSNSRTPNIDSVLENAAVSLWNFAVGLKTKGSLSSLSNAKLRYISLLLVDTYLTDEVDGATLKKIIMMGIKTARAWLDAKRPKLADKTLQITDEYVKVCQRIIVQKINSNGPSDQLKQQKIDIEQNVFKILCYRAESCLEENRCQEALEMALLAKEMLVNFPKEGAFLSMMCYNFGVDMYQKKRYEEAVTWLRESFELGKGKNSIGSKNQARTLRLLASTYIEWSPKEHLQKALNAVTLANAEHSHPAGLYIKLKILLVNGDSDEVIGRAVEDILQQSGTSVDMVLSLTQLLNESKRYEVSKEVLVHSLTKFDSSPDLGKLKTTQLELLLQSKQAEAAKQLVEQSIIDHNTGQPLDKDVLKRFHVLLWEKAGEEFESKDYQSSLDWYNYSLSLYEVQSGDKNLAKLHRNRANCYINLQMNVKADDVLHEAEKYDPESVHTQFTMYKLALAQSDLEKAKASLHKMCVLATNSMSEDSDVHSLICLAAHMAFEQQQQSTASEALECLANTSPDHLQVLTSLRCLIRMSLSDSQEKSINMEKITKHIRTGYNKLLQLIGERKDMAEQLRNEASWFMKISWNMALQNEDNPQCMRDLFSLCCQLSSLCEVENNQLSRQKTCRLMAAAASLQVARTSINQLEQRNSLEDALHHVEECKRLCCQIQSNILSSTDIKSKDTTDILLLLYEFEARVKLNDHRVEEILEKALKLPSPDPKTFETLAALAVEEPAQNKSVSVRALKVAIRKHLQMPEPDYNRCSKLFHSLIQLSLSGGMELCGKEEAWNYFVEVIDIIDKKSQGQYPEIEILWLMTKAWNCGINFYSSGRYSDAEKWCATSMKLLLFLGPLRSNYEDHMNNTYSEILAKIEASRTKGKFKGQEE